MVSSPSAASREKWSGSSSTRPDTLFIRERHCKGGDSRCPVSQNRGQWENCPGPLSHCELKRKEKRIVSRRKIQTRGKPPSQSLSTRAFLDLLRSSAGICGVLPPPSSLFPATSLVRPAPLHSQLGATLSIRQQPVSRAPPGSPAWSLEGNAAVTRTCLARSPSRPRCLIGLASNIWSLSCGAPGQLLGTHLKVKVCPAPESVLRSREASPPQPALTCKLFSHSPHLLSCFAITLGAQNPPQIVRCRRSSTLVDGRGVHLAVPSC